MENRPTDTLTVLQWIEVIHARWQALQDRVPALVGALQAANPLTVVAVTKYSSDEQIQAAYSLGFRVFGENQVQVALAKQQRLQSFVPEAEWHLIGPLQSNKVNKCLPEGADSPSFNLLQAVGSLSTLTRVSKRACSLSFRQPVLLQVNASEEPQKQGVAFDELAALVEQAVQLPGIQLQGLMGMAAAGVTDEQLDATFSRLQTAQHRLLASGFDLPVLSMGMSQDVHRALLFGATHVRLGSILFGPLSPQEHQLLQQ